MCQMMCKLPHAAPHNGKFLERTEVTKLVRYSREGRSVSDTSLYYLLTTPLSDIKCTWAGISGQ
jgi:hypothetical protein